MSYIEARRQELISCYGFLTIRKREGLHTRFNTKGAKQIIPVWSTGRRKKKRVRANVTDIESNRSAVKC